MRVIRFFFKLMVYFFAFCNFFYFIFLAERYVDLKDDEKFRNWLGREFEMKKGVFIHHQFATNRFYLEVSTAAESFPQNIDEYLQSPEKWGNGTEDWRQPVIPGTRFKIERIYIDQKPAVVSIFIIQAVIVNGIHKNLRVQAREIFKCDHITHEIFSPKNDLCREVLYD